jgi:hypothetical protein
MIIIFNRIRSNLINIIYKYAGRRKRADKYGYIINYKLINLVLLLQRNLSDGRIYPIRGYSDGKILNPILAVTAIYRRERNN